MLGALGVVSLPSCVALGQILDVSETWFSHLSKGTLWELLARVAVEREMSGGSTA